MAGPNNDDYPGGSENRMVWESEVRSGEFSTERTNGILRVTCLRCEEFRLARDKGMGRANLATWKTRHQHPAPPTAEPRPEPSHDSEEQR